MNFLNKQRDWLLPTVLILFILEVIAFPFAVGFTWAARSEVPERVLTYTPGKLTWDSAADIDENGVANLSLFDTLYHNVVSENGEKVVAPGTEGYSIVRLKNTVGRDIKYIAVLYRIHSTDLLPVNTSLEGDGFTDTDTYPLPTGVNDENVIRAVTGKVAGNMIQDFDIEWNWRFYDSDDQDVIDTWLGDKAAFEKADDILVGLYIVVIDEGLDIDTDTDTDTETETETDPETDPDTDTDTETDPETDPDTEPDTETDPGKDTEPDTTPGKETDPETKPNKDPDPETKPNKDPDPETDPDREPEDKTDPTDNPDPVPIVDEPIISDDPTDDPDYITPEAPQTGDFRTGIYITLMSVSGVILILLIIDKIKERRCEQQQEQ